MTHSMLFLCETRWTRQCLFYSQVQATVFDRSCISQVLLGLGHAIVENSSFQRCVPTWRSGPEPGEKGGLQRLQQLFRWAAGAS